MESQQLDFVILTATETEQQLLRETIGGVEQAVIAHRQVVFGQVFGKRLALVKTGIGPVNTAQSLTAMIEHKRPLHVVQTGIAGAFPSSGLRVGDIAIATEEIWGEFGIVDETGWLDGENIGIPLLDGDPPLYNRIPLNRSHSETALASARTMSDEFGNHVQGGPFLTLQNVTGTDEQARILSDRFGALCENMEGASSAQVCTLYGIPFTEIRGISNIIEKRDLSTWDIPTAATRAQSVVLELIQSS